MLNSVFLKDKYFNFVLPEFSTEAEKRSLEKVLIGTLKSSRVLGVIEHRQAVKVEERTEPTWALC